MSGDDFYNKQVLIKEILGPLFEQGVHTADPTVRQALNDILVELKAIHWHLAAITSNDPEEIRRDMK